MARSLVAEALRPLTNVSQYACLVCLVLFFTASSAPISSRSLACSSGGQLLEAFSEHAGSRHHPYEVAAARLAKISFPADIVSSDGVVVFQTSSFLICRSNSPFSLPSELEPPVPVLVASPIQNGTYPVILFKHGFLLLTCLYTELFKLLATSGYIVVAPQYFLGEEDLTRNCSREIEQTAEVANWIPSSLQSVLNVAIPDGNVVPDMSKIVLAGHSRGGKIAFALALGKASMEVPSFSALVALDPVDDFSIDSPSEPQLVEPGCNHTKNQVAFPILILGTGYGSEDAIPLLVPACAPACCSHGAYFNCSSAPIMYQFVASDYGHLNFLNVFYQYLLFLLPCKSGSPGLSLNNFTREVTVAFLEHALDHSQTSMDSLLDNWESASIKLEEPQIYTESNANRIAQMK